MNAEKYLKTQAEICKERYNCGCEGCPYEQKIHNYITHCLATEIDEESINKKISIAEKYLEEKAGITYKQDLLKKFPRAWQIKSTGQPVLCRDELYKGSGCSDNKAKSCNDCWNEIMPVTSND